MFRQLAHLTQRAVGGVKKARRHAKRRLGMFGPVQIVPFRGYGTPTKLFVSGRVLEAKGVITAVDEHTQALAPTGHGDPTSAWTNLRATMARLRSDEVPDARLRLTLGENEVETTTDDEGYFDVNIELPGTGPRLEPGWHDVRVDLISSPVGPGHDEATAVAPVLVPPQDAEFAVISDLDDTVIETRVLHRLQMLRLVLFKDARGRIPFPGVAAFYRALKLGSDGRRTNPIFYVSKSPWNLYDLYDAFFELNDIPRGPIFLRDLHLLEAPSKALGAHQDKLSRIRKLLRLYPRTAFVLVGDSGQKDPEVYRQIALEHPGRIRAIYIRDVSSSRRDRQVRELADQLRDTGIPTLLVESTDDAAEHAVTLGLIAPPATAEIERRAQRDAMPTPTSPAPEHAEA